MCNQPFRRQITHHVGHLCRCMLQVFHQYSCGNYLKPITSIKAYRLIAKDHSITSLESTKD